MASTASSPTHGNQWKAGMVPLEQVEQAATGIRAAIPMSASASASAARLGFLLLVFHR